MTNCPACRFFAIRGAKSRYRHTVSESFSVWSILVILFSSFPQKAGNVVFFNIFSTASHVIFAEKPIVLEYNKKNEENESKTIFADITGCVRGCVAKKRVSKICYFPTGSNCKA
jgi:hypothetical protein